MWKSTGRSLHSHRTRRLTHLSILDGALLQSEASFFEPYVEGDMAAFLRYLDIKRRNAVWGDDPEVQALCEIYDRPAEIWAYDLQVHVRSVSALTIWLYGFCGWRARVHGMMAFFSRVWLPQESINLVFSTIIVDLQTVAKPKFVSVEVQWYGSTHRWRCRTSA